MEEKKVEGILKVEDSKELKKGKLSFARKFVSALTALSMSVFIALGTTACAGTEQEPNVPPVNPNPPVVNPIDPDKPDPDKPDQPVVEKTEIDGQWDETGDYPVFNLTDKSLSKFVKTTYYSGTEIVTEIKAGESYRVVLTLTDNEKYKFAEKVETEKNFTAKNENQPPEPEVPDLKPDLTQQEVVEKIINTIEPNIQRVIGKKSIIDKYLALDFKVEESKNNLYALVQFQTQSNGSYVTGVDLIKISMNTEPSQSTIKNDQFKPTSATTGSLVVSVPAQSQDDRAEDVLVKLKAQQKAISYDLVNVFVSPGLTLDIGGTKVITVYTINKDGICEIRTNARSDGDRIDPIGQSVLKGVCGVDYTIPVVKEYKFSEKVLYDFQGLEKDTSSEIES